MTLNSKMILLEIVLFIHAILSRIEESSTINDNLSYVNNVSMLAGQQTVKLARIPLSQPVYLLLGERFLCSSVLELFSVCRPQRCVYASNLTHLTQKSSICKASQLTFQLNTCSCNTFLANIDIARQAKSPFVFYLWRVCTLTSVSEKQADWNMWTEDGLCVFHGAFYVWLPRVLCCCTAMKVFAH